jgi:hypothetical protein
MLIQHYFCDLGSHFEALKSVLPIFTIIMIIISGMLRVFMEKIEKKVSKNFKEIKSSNFKEIKSSSKFFSIFFMHIWECRPAGLGGDRG